MIEKDLEYTGEYSSPPYERYKDNREIFQEAGNTLTEGLYAALEGRLTILGIPKETIRTVYYVDNYGDDDVILNRLIGMGLERNVASTILNECRAEAENALRKEILAKDLSEDVVSSVLNYVIVIQRVRTAGAANDDDNHDLWARQQMYQLGAAGENCPLHYLDAVIGAATFLIAQHPDPTTGTFNIYKRFSQPGGHIHLREVVESLEKKGLEPNQVRAILNLHKHYGANLGSAYLALLQHAHELVDYKGGVLQLVADFADRKISPALQVAIVSQTENHVDYPGGSLQLAMDLSERHISPPLQEALISNWSYLKDYDKGIIQLALDLVAAGFSLAMQLNLVRQLVNRGISPSEPARPYILGLRKLYVVNPECVSKEFGSEYGKLAYYALVAPTPQKTLLALVTDTAAEKLPDLSSEHRIKLFSALLVLIQYPRYEYYREVAFLVANRAAEMELGAFDNAVMQINQLAQMFDRSGSNSNPKGALPLATNLAQDVVAIANQDQPQMKARWYDNLIYRGADREDIMPVLQVPIDNDNWQNRDLAFRPCFDVIATRFFSDDPIEHARLLPIVALLLREAYHYHLSIHMLEDKQPNRVICRYVFGVGPEEEGGITVADIACCEAMVDHKPVAAAKLVDGLKVIRKLEGSFPEFAARLTTTVFDEVQKEYCLATNRNYDQQVPFELVVGYLQLDPAVRCSHLVDLFARPSTSQRLSLVALDQLIDISALACESYPHKADQIDAFCRLVIGRQNPLYQRALRAGYTPKALIASVATTNSVGVLVRSADAPEMARLAKYLDAKSVVAEPTVIDEMVPNRLTRAAASQLGYGAKNKAGMLLGMLAETWPGVQGKEMKLDDDLGPVWRYVLQSRIERPGFPVEGAKLHVAKAVDLKLVDTLIQELGLASTPFRTIHAGKTVLLPPGQPIEIKVILNYLKAKGLFNDQDFDMQVCIGGRLRAKKHVASIGVLNAAMLLATKATPSYTVDAWSTPDHNELTNAYIMAYGDGVRVKSMPYDILDPNDRTDRLGCRSLDDLDLYQIICTLIMHYEFGGYFADLGEIFLRRVIAILQRYQLYDTLFEAPWVFEVGVTPRTADTATLKHWQMVQKYTAMRIVAEDMPHRGITGEVRRVVAETYNEATKRFDQIRRERPDEFGKLCTL